MTKPPKPKDKKIGRSFTSCNNYFSNKNKISKNFSGLKDLLFKGENFVSTDEKHNRAASSRAPVQLPINNI